MPVESRMVNKTGTVTGWNKQVVTTRNDVDASRRVNLQPLDSMGSLETGTPDWEVWGQCFARGQQQGLNGVPTPGCW